MNENLISLIEQLREVREEFGNYLQMPAAKEDVERLSNVVKEKFKIELSPIYQSILLKTNGFNENGVFLYGSETSLLRGYSDRYLRGLLETNETWHESYDGFSKYLFYADSDSYLFGQSIENKLFTCYAKESFGEYLIFETNNDFEFFEKIFRLAVDDDFSLE